jgi:hypothetical protein
MFTLCKPISTKKRFAPHRRLNEDFTFTLFDRASAIPKKEWLEVTKGQSVFLEPEFLSLIENCVGTKLSARYIIVYSNRAPCGIIYYQVTDFKAGVFDDLLFTQVEKIRSARFKLFENYIGSNKEEVLMRLLTCGNNIVSGEYGFRFKNSVKENTITSVVLEVTDVISREEKLRGTISAILIKDFVRKLVPNELIFKEKYTDFLIEPNMVIELPPEINSLSDYIQQFSKKYRNRAKSILKSGSGLDRKIISGDLIKLYESKIYDLYSSVYEKAKFKLLKLPTNYFSEVKKIFPDRFFICGFFLGEKLIAFSSYFIMPDNSFEAHYIGFDYTLNQEFDLYQNILYKNIECAIENKKSIVNLGRTAAEIKTTVGAKPIDLYCYVRPQNTISKIILKPFIQFLQPSEWTARNPFKEDVLQNGPEEKE